MCESNGQLLLKNISWKMTSIEGCGDSSNGKNPL